MLSLPCLAVLPVLSVLSRSPHPAGDSALPQLHYSRSTAVPELPMPALVVQGLPLGLLAQMMRLQHLY
jgi:hypothetical protein